MAEEKVPLEDVIKARLAVIAAATPSPSWATAWNALGSRPAMQARLSVYKAVRDESSIPEDASFFLLAWLLDLLTEDRLEEAMQEVDAHLEQVRRKFGIDPDTPATGDVPDEYKAAMKQSHRVWNELYASTMEEFGESELAQLFRNDQAEFDRRSDAGRRFFRPADDLQDWLDQLHSAVSACIEAESPMGPFGMNYMEDDAFLDVFVYPKPVELLGGPHDGAVVMPGFHLDLEQLRGSFESITASGWNALGLTSPDGPYVFIEGVFQGREVYLQVQSDPPEDEEPGLKLNTDR